MDVPFDEVKAHFQALFLGQRHRRPDPARALDRATRRPRKAQRAISLRAFSPAARREEAELTLRRFAPELGLRPIVAMDDVRTAQARTRRAAANTRRANPGAQALLRRRHRRRRALRPRRRRAVHRHRRARQPALSRPGLPVSGGGRVRHRRRHQLSRRGIRRMRSATIARDTKETRIAGAVDASKAAAATRSPPAFASSITCWSCSPSTAAST